MLSDPIADMLTRIRNASTANHAEVAVPASRMKTEIARLLQEEGFIAGYRLTEPGVRQLIVITLKPRTREGRRPLSGLRRISRPGLRVYARKTEIPRVLGGLGIALISTSQGLMTGRSAQRAGLGGEVVAYVW